MRSNFMFSVLGGIVLFAFAGCRREDALTKPDFAACYEDCGGGGGGGTPTVPSVRFTAVAANTGNSGNVQVILTGTDGLAYLTYQVNPSGNWYWRGLLPNPNRIPLRSIATGRGNDWNLQVLGIGQTDGLPYLTYQVHSSGNWYWAGQVPSSNGFRFSSAFNGVGDGHDGNFWNFLAMPALGLNDGLPYVAWQNVGSGGWSSYPANTTATGAFAPVSGAGRLNSLVGLTPEEESTPIGGQGPFAYQFYSYFFGLGPDNLPYWISLRDGPWRWSWEGPLPNGIPSRSLTAGLGDDEGPGLVDKPQVIGLRASDGQPYLIYQAYESGNWYPGNLPPNPYGLAFRTLVSEKGNDRNLQVILLGETDGRPYLLYQVHASSNWYWGPPLPVPANISFTQLATTKRCSMEGLCQQLYVVGLRSTDGLPYLFYQNISDGSWHWHGPLPVQ